MNPITLYFLVFFPTLIAIFLLVVVVRSLMVYQHAKVMVKRIAPENNALFQENFMGIEFSYVHSKGDKVSTSPFQRADLHWSGPAFVLIREKKFLPLGSLLPMVFAVSTNPYKTKEDFSDLEVYGLVSVKADQQQATLTLKSATQADLRIELHLKNLNADQLAYVRRLKR